MLRHGIFIATLLGLLALPALAAENDRTGRMGSRRTRFAFAAGPTFAHSTTFTRTSAAGTTTSSNTDPAGYAFGGEFDYDLTPYFGLGGLLSYANYANANSPDAPDRELSFLVLPRLFTGNESCNVWVGVGIGVMHTAIGTGQATGKDWSGAAESPNSFTWSPRAGADFALGTSFFAGGQLAYVSTSGTLTLSPTSSIGYSRHWVELSAVIGLRY